MLFDYGQTLPTVFVV